VALPGARPEQAESIFHGFSVAAVLQMLSLERKSATVTIETDLGVGTVALVEGELIHATLGSLAGDDAALTLLAIPQSRVGARASTGPTLRTISTPLEHLIIEALRREDEGVQIPPSTIGAVRQDEDEQQFVFADVEQFANVISAIDGVRSIAVVDQSSETMLFDTAPTDLLRDALRAECCALAVALGDGLSQLEVQDRETLTSMGDVCVLTVWDTPQDGLTTSVVLSRRGQIQQIRRAIHRQDSLSG
jgi:hypothetical protein